MSDDRATITFVYRAEGTSTPSGDGVRVNRPSGQQVDQDGGTGSGVSQIPESVPRPESRPPSAEVPQFAERPRPADPPAVEPVERVEPAEVDIPEPVAEKPNAFGELPSEIASRNREKDAQLRAEGLRSASDLNAQSRAERDAEDRAIIDRAFESTVPIAPSAPEVAAPMPSAPDAPDPPTVGSNRDFGPMSDVMADIQQRRAASMAVNQGFGAAEYEYGREFATRAVQSETGQSLVKIAASGVGESAAHAQAIAGMAGVEVAEVGSAAALAGIEGIGAMASAAALPLAIGVAGTASAVALSNRLQGRAETFSQYNAELATAMAMRDVNQLMQDINEANIYAPELARIEELQAESSRAMDRILNDLGGAMTPIRTDLEEMKTGVLGLIERVTDSDTFQSISSGAISAGVIASLRQVGIDVPLINAVLKWFSTNSGDSAPWEPGQFDHLQIDGLDGMFTQDRVAIPKATIGGI